MTMNRVTSPRRPWQIPLSAACAALLALGAAGCTDNSEDCYEQGGALFPVTTDTLATDHFDAAVSPDNTTILFTSDAWVEEFETDKANGERDYAMIDVPASDEFRQPVPLIERIGNARRIVLGTMVDETGVSFRAIGKNKGQASWVDDDEFIAAVQNAEGFERLFWLRLEPETQLDIDRDERRTSVVRVIDDLDFDNLPQNEVQYFYRTPAVSPDGSWLAYQRFFFDPGVQPDNSDEISVIPAIFAINLDDLRNGTSTVVRVTNGATKEQDPTWSPDGNFIAFTTNAGRVGSNEIYRIRFDPANPAPVRIQDPDTKVYGPFNDGRVQLTDTVQDEDLKLITGSFNPTWLPSGSIVFTSTERTPCTSLRLRNLWIMDGSGGDLRPFVVSEEDDFGAGAGGNLVVFSSRRNMVSDFEGTKADLWMIRGGL